jgi:hypothetical protein
LIPPPTTKVTMKNLNYTATGTSYCEIEWMKKKRRQNPPKND